MSSDNRTFTHITVNADEEDDLVIQAGAVVEPADAEEGDSPTGEEALGEAGFVGDGEARKNVGAFDPEGACSGQSEGADEARAEEAGSAAQVAGEEDDAPRYGSSDAESAARDETAARLEELKGSKMGGMQKAIVIVAVVAIIAFVVYYMFFM